MGFSSNPFLHKLLRLTGETSLLKEGNSGGSLGYRFPPWANRSSIDPQNGQEVLSTLVPLGLVIGATRGTIGARPFGFTNPPEFARVGYLHNAREKVN